MNLAPPKIVAQNQVKYSDFHFSGKQASVGARAGTREGVNKWRKQIFRSGGTDEYIGTYLGTRNLTVGRLYISTEIRICSFHHCYSQYQIFGLHFDTQFLGVPSS